MLSGRSEGSALSARNEIFQKSKAGRWQPALPLNQRHGFHQIPVDHTAHNLRRLHFFPPEMFEEKLKDTDIMKTILYTVKRFFRKTKWLSIDFKNRTADFAAEQEKADKKLMRKLNAAPDSVMALSQLWSYKKTADGTITNIH